MYTQQRAVAQYRQAHSHGAVAGASPTRLVQIMFEHILSQLAIAQGATERIKNNMPLVEVVAKGKSLNKAVRLIDQLNATLDMDRGEDVAQNLRSLYEYMLQRLTLANVSNDAKVIAEVISLVQKIKSSWDQIVEQK